MVRVGVASCVHRDRIDGAAGVEQNLGLLEGRPCDFGKVLKGGIEITVGMEYGETKKVNLYFISTIYGVHFFFLSCSCAHCPERWNPHLGVPTAQKKSKLVLHHRCSEYDYGCRCEGLAATATALAATISIFQSVRPKERQDNFHSVVVPRNELHMEFQSFRLSGQKSLKIIFTQARLVQLHEQLHEQLHNFNSQTAKGPFGTAQLHL
jgi:hypothetical protein